ncbi:hypothetical protein [Sinorhizobium medicae]|jgi:hypothetical protein|uniref:Uncharacterized protein n=1 Tax=Sinorhizobium medicae TaxID=110321 RepID=A0ABX4TDB0_9HYPH|nr:hypothetical protein [Sinorhizobium medicae]PLT94968.1 hypothetical protein BMJ33_30765 [Sinorhizobium medicae]PLU11606.1 hypothetical protein BMJ29_34275 [Sinorhizobium medicae]
MKSKPGQLVPSIEECVKALADTLVRIERPETDRSENVAPIVSFLLATLAKMPDYLRVAFRILTLVFDAWPLVVTGKPFHRLDLAGRINQVEQWNQSRLVFRQALIAFYRSFVIFGLYSELSKEDAYRGVCTKQD